VIIGAPAPIKGVIFDFHGTLVDGGDPVSWIDAAAQRLGCPLNGSTAPGTEEFEGLRKHLDRIWEHAFTIDPNSERDLSHRRHRDVFTQTISLRPEVAPDLIDALYAVMPDQWLAFDDTVPVLRELRARGLRIVVLSNIGLDIRDRLNHIGVSDLIDGVVLSYEVGMVKPEPGIFTHALEILDLPASQALMVGDSWRDDVGGAALGIRTLILPRTAGPIHGLDAVLRLVGQQPG
jgi:HAD superfamily hydrolase (TIGR01509 family)